jgi:hypothetical protein
VRLARAGVIATEGLPVAAELTVRGKLVLIWCIGLAESLTVKVSERAAAVAVGVPEIMPAAFRARPAGRVPAVSAHDSGAMPPLAFSVAV